MEMISFFLAIFAGTVISALFSCLPALHIYNVVGILMVLAMEFQNQFSGDILVTFMMSLVVGFSFLNTIPAIWGGTPDETTLFLADPGSEYLREGRGYEALILSGIGSLGALFFVVFLIPFAPTAFPVIRGLITPYLVWILGAILFFLLFTNRKKKSLSKHKGFQDFFFYQKPFFLGGIIILLSGLLGFIIFYKPLLPVEYGFQNMLPLFAGLFALPWILKSLFFSSSPPKQNLPKKSVDVNHHMIIQGVRGGCFGGLFSAIFPFFTGGIGAFLGEQAVLSKDKRLLMISHGASKVVFYVGGFMVIFVPSMEMPREGMSWMVQNLDRPVGWNSQFLMGAVLLLSGAMSFLLLMWLGRLAVYLTNRFSWKIPSLIALFLVCGIIFWRTGWQGMALAIVASAIGMIPIVFSISRANCLGVILVPAVLNLSGVGSKLAYWMGLL